MTQSVLPQAVASVAQLHPYIPGKPVNELEREYGVKNAVKVASNENPLGPSPKVLAHLNKLLQEPQELSRYPDGNGFVLKNKLLEKLSPELADLSIEQITLGNGSNDILDLLARAFASINDEVIFSQYAFAVYPIATQAVGATAVITQASDWGYDLDAMLTAITNNTRLIFIANPNNPTGTCLSADDLQSFLEKVPKNIVVVIDEAYEEYASHPGSGFSQDYHSMIASLGQFENLVITRTFSKAYGLASFRVGYSLSSIAIADMLNRVRQPFNNNTFALESAAIALDDFQHLQNSVELNCQGMAFLVNAFKSLGLSYIPSAGNFVCVKTGPDSAQIYEKLLYEGVITRPVANYQMAEYLRISIGTMDESQRVFEALKKVLSR
ncbi:MAG: histidinol-phosphate transaminase [gamma proteobacterium symbiont of Bathyaustriella thionipta]|nr:histidinol-phosphate transaminase [gamma proteobacterium symbiont of Bathyaustriella thionipta]MCU7949238.1 histidinol-phosphate transaminase [gamma proteobacterium symbiont of Bathyaustriella thionipta]MCU7954802.1 histidinol-phosphate transaminase [gamma proteobacterium symbiont of Bathyaustriella thionipta]MCU7955820.1 histidinol-phosphate transaminase [gamma proteobacterium symbiont of Bathyaustriella thionipta]